MTLIQLYAALATAKASGNGAAIASVEAQIAAMKSAASSEEDPDESKSEEDDDDEEKSEEDEKSADDDGDDDEDGDEEKAAKKSGSCAGKRGKYKKSKAKSEDIAAAVSEVFGDLEPDVLKGRLMALKDAGESTKQLEAKVNALTKQQRQSEVSSLVSRGVREGKIAPAQKEFWTGQGMKSPATLREFLKTAPAMTRSEPHQPSSELVPAGGLSALEQEINTKLGTNTEKYQKEKARIEREGHFVCTYT